MSISLKLVLAACMLSTSLMSSSEAGKRSSFQKSSPSKRMSSNRNLFQSGNSNKFSSKSTPKKSTQNTFRNNQPALNGLKSAPRRLQSPANKNLIQNKSRFQPQQKVMTQPLNSTFIKGVKSNAKLPGQTIRPINSPGLANQLGNQMMSKKGKKPDPSDREVIPFPADGIGPGKKLNKDAIKKIKPIIPPNASPVNPGLIKPLPTPVNPGVVNPGVLKPIFPPGKTPLPPGGVVKPLPVPPLKPILPPGGVVTPLPIPPLKPIPPLPVPPKPPYCPPHHPPHYCPPGFWPRPICLPPIHLHRPVCRPCVANVCPNVIIDETVIVEEPLEEAVAEPMFQLLVGRPATLEAEGLGNVPGFVAIEVGGIGLPTQVRSWADKMLVIDVPFVGLNGPTPAMLHLFDANGKPLASIPVELVVPEEELPAEAAE